MRRTDDRSRAGPASRAPPGGDPPRPGGDRQRLQDVPLLRDQPRQAYYKWLRRYEAGGITALRDGSSRPHTSPRATSAEVVGKIVYLRQTYHFGPHKIAMYLERYHDLELEPVGDLADPEAPRHEPAAGIPALPSPPRPLEAIREAAARPPGPDRREVHRAVAGVEARSTTSSPRSMTAPGSGSCGSTTGCNQKTAIQFLDEVMARLPFRVETVQTDNGSEFQSGFHYHVLDRGIGHVYIRPATPRLNGKVERSTGSTPRSSTGCSTAWSSTTQDCSTSASGSGRTSTTTTDRMAVSAARRRMSDCDRRPEPRCDRPSVARLPKEPRETPIGQRAAPVWQVGQYCSARLANATSRTVSPHTGHGRPVRPCTRMAERFSSFRSDAGSAVVARQRLLEHVAQCPVQARHLVGRQVPGGPEGRQPGGMQRSRPNRRSPRPRSPTGRHEVLELRGPAREQAAERRGVEGRVQGFDAQPRDALDRLRRRARRGREPLLRPGLGQVEAGGRRRASPASPGARRGGWAGRPRQAGLPAGLARRWSRSRRASGASPAARSAPRARAGSE